MERDHGWVTTKRVVLRRELHEAANWLLAGWIGYLEFVQTRCRFRRGSHRRPHGGGKPGKCRSAEGLFSPHPLEDGLAGRGVSHGEIFPHEIAKPDCGECHLEISVTRGCALEPAIDGDCQAAVSRQISVEPHPLEGRHPVQARKGKLSLDLIDRGDHRSGCFRIDGSGPLSERCHDGSGTLLLLTVTVADLSHLL